MNQQEAKKLEKKISESLQKHIDAKNTIIAALSAGPDSMFLLHFLNKTDAEIIIAHLNHKFRKEADEEEGFIREQANKFDFKFETKALKIKKIADKKGKGFEETGRNERYKFFQNLAEKHQAKFIVTAHHANDNLETVLLNFTRGASLQGLTGMAEVENNLFRPLLSITKQEILDYLKLKQIPYHEDSTNLDNNYTRNFLRNIVIPQLEKINPNLVKTNSLNLNNLKEINSYIIEKAKNFLNNSPTKIDAKIFRQQHPALQKQILLEAHRQIIGNTTNLSTKHLDEILSIIRNNIGNKEKKLGQTTVSLKNNLITLKKN